MREDVLVPLWVVSGQWAHCSPSISLAITVRNDTGVQAKIVYLRTEDPKRGQYNQVILGNAIHISLK